MSESFTHVVTNGVVLHRSNIIKPKPGNRLRIVEEVDPAGIATDVAAMPVPELLGKGVPGIRPIAS